jgi:RNA ligase (TIGR02306 family)
MKLATFETITEIFPIEGADRIEIARVQGWQSVIRKGEYKVGDKVIFVPIDTVLPPAEWNKFLWDKNDPTKPIRVKTIKLKGVVSQGLIFPSSLVSAQEIWDHADDASEDVSIAGMLGISKYEKPVPAHLAGQVAGVFPTHLVSKTDEDNLKSNIEVLEELREADFVETTIKLDGCLDASTLIETERGLMSIKQIVDSGCIGLKVLTLDVDTREIEYQPILIVFANENTSQKEWYEVELEDGTILNLTGNHKIFLPELNCYRETKDLSINDIVLSK